MLAEIEAISTIASEKCVFEYAMGALEAIKRMLATFSSEEKETVRAYLSIFDMRGTRVNSKYVLLYSVLINSEPESTKTADKLERLIYRKGNEKAFGQLVYRLREKIMEALIIDVNVNRKNAYSKRSQAFIEVRKNITQGQILQSRGLRDIAAELFENAIEECKKYELYEELLLALRLKIEHHTSDEGDRHLKKLRAAYYKYDQAKNAVLRSEINYGRVSVEINFRSGHSGTIEKIRQYLDEMSDDYQKTQSSTVGFYFFFVEAQFYQLLNDYKRASRSLQNNLKLLAGSPGIYTDMRYGNVMLNLADNMIYEYEFENSETKTREAMAMFKEGSFNFSQGLELLFYSQFYSGNYEYAKRHLLSIVPLNKNDKTNQKNGKRIYLITCACFMLNDFQSAYQILGRLNAIENDKEGWNLAIRILTIMCLVELNDNDEAAVKVNAMRVFFQKLEKSNISMRLRKIYSLLLKLEQSGFDFKSVYQKEKKTIEELEDIKGESCWKIKSPEMIIFHQWFISKVFRLSFKQEVSKRTSKPKFINVSR